MGFVIALFVIFLFVLSSKNKKEKAKRQAAKGGKREISGRVKADAKPRAESQTVETAPTAETPPVGSAHSHDAADYSGEGETPEEHAEHLSAMRAAEQARREARKSACEAGSLRRENLRAAIVMSEVLDKPVALRPPRF